MAAARPLPLRNVDAAVAGWFHRFWDQGLFTTDTNLVIQVWNHWMEVHSGQAAAAVIGRRLLDVWPDLAKRGLASDYEEAARGRARVVAHGLHEYLIPMRSKTGADVFKHMPQSAHIAPLLEGESIIGTITVIQDVSERVLREAELRRQVEALDAARLRAEAAVKAKDVFLAKVSHELRTPLNAVLGWTRLLRSSALDAAAIANALDVIERNAAAQGRLIDDLLDIVRVTTGKLGIEVTTLDFASLVRDAIDVVMLAAAAKGVFLRSSIDTGLPPVVGDRNRLQQVVWNLLSNAVKFTDRAGVVDVRVLRDGGHLVLTVTDTGRGIAPEFLPRVFELFSQAEGGQRHTGLGLGLALVKELVQLHGGAVRADSAGPGKGATFTVTLPLPGSMEQTRAADARRGPLAGLTVLVVDDIADTRELIRAQLEGQGASPIVAESPEAAMAFLAQSRRSERPAVIVADLGMQGESGLAFIRRVRQLAPEQGGRIPAIAVSAHAGPAYRGEALEAGYHAYVLRPVEVEGLAAAIVEVVKRSLPVTGLEE